MSVFRFRFQPLLDQAAAEREAAERQLLEREKAVVAIRQRIERMEAEATAQDRRLREQRTAAAAFSGGAVQLQQRRIFLERQAHELGDFRHEIFLERLKLTEAEAAVTAARAMLAEARRRVETLEKYRDKLLLRFRRKQEEAEEAELSEIGSTLYTSRRRHENR